MDVSREFAAEFNQLKADAQARLLKKYRDKAACERTVRELLAALTQHTPSYEPDIVFLAAGQILAGVITEDW